MARMIYMATKSPKSPALPPAPAIKPDEVGGGDSVVLERRPQKTKPPQMYQVVLLNDDYTPMEFVVVARTADRSERHLSSGPLRPWRSMALMARISKNMGPP